MASKFDVGSFNLQMAEVTARREVLDVMTKDGYTGDEDLLPSEIATIGLLWRA